MRVPLIRQASRTECGLAALAMLATHLGVDTDLPRLRQLAGHSANTASLQSLLDLARLLGLEARPLRLSLGQLNELTTPAILHWRFDHYVVLVRVRRRYLEVHDPAVGRRRIRRADAQQSFTGVAVECSRAATFSTRRGTQRPLLTGLLRSLRGFWRHIATMLALMLVVQLLALAPPIISQRLIDNLALGNDPAWLTRLLLALAAVMLAGLVLEAGRKWLALSVAAHFAVASNTAWVTHLMSLPLAALSGRPAGDILSRLESMRPVRTALTETSVNGVMQLLVIVSSLALMAAYHLPLALLSLLAFLLAIGAQLVFAPASRAANMEGLVSAAAASHSLIDTLNARATVDLMALESRRVQIWQQHFATSTRAVARVAGLQIGQSTLVGLVSIADFCVFLGIGISTVASGAMTLGVLFAFLALRGRLQSATTGLLAVIGELILLRAHVERAAEIILLPRREPASPAALRRRVRGALQIIELGFAYPGREPLFRNLGGQIGAGEHVVIRGPSGSGKTTLLLLLAGALTPQAGRIELDGQPLKHWDRRAMGRQTAAVLQGDRLFEGHVIDNISGFDPTPDIAEIRSAAVAACIWDELLKLPMGLRTPLDATAPGLSGGQVQRLLLARALYRRPRVLFLDEATSHLDAATEDRVLSELTTLPVTIISVAHRARALQFGGRAIELGAQQSLS